MLIDPAHQKKNRPWLRAAVPGCLVGLGLIGVPDFLAGFRAGMAGAASPGSSSGLGFTWEFLFEWVVLSAVATIAIKRYRDIREEAERQRRLAEQSRDAALRAKLAPHFIFNALNTLHAQIEGDPRGAQATTERLAQLFRQVLEGSDRGTVPLREELAFVEGYLGIEKARLGDRLSVQIDVPEDLEPLEIPPLSLQVLVENAVTHGVASLERGGLVRIEARQEGDFLVLSVTDPGCGQGSRKGSGTALATLRARLAQPEHLELGAVEGGFRAGFRWSLA